MKLSKKQKEDLENLRDDLRFASENYGNVDVILSAHKRVTSKEDARRELNAIAEWCDAAAKDARSLRSRLRERS